MIILLSFGPWTQTILSSLNFECVETQKVLMTIKTSASKHGCGVDGISTNFVKRIAHIITEPLTNNKSITLYWFFFLKNSKSPKLYHFTKRGTNTLSITTDQYHCCIPSNSALRNQVYDYFEKNNICFTLVSMASGKPTRLNSPKSK